METFTFNDDLKSPETGHITLDTIDDGIALLRILQDWYV